MRKSIRETKFDKIKKSKGRKLEKWNRKRRDEFIRGKI